MTLISTASGIGVSISGDAGTVSERITNLDIEDSLTSSVELYDDQIISDTKIYGNTEVEISTTGGDKSFAAGIMAEDIEFSQTATSDGVGGDISAAGNTLFSSSDIGYLSDNPDLAMSIDGLTAGGKTMSVVGGAYPADGSYDPSSPWYIDPARTFKFRTMAANWETFNDIYTGAETGHADLRKLRTAITNAGNEINTATGKPIFDGVETGRVGIFINDGVNSVMFAPNQFMPSYTAYTRTVYYTSSRKAIDIDIALNERYTNVWNWQPGVDFCLLHEMMHAAGMEHNYYSATSVMNPTNGNVRHLSGDDKTFVKAKYSDVPAS